MTVAASFVRGGDGLLGLHDALVQDRFVVGPGELLAATRLMVRLQDAGLMPDDAQDLLPYLRAVYCKSSAEQKRFDAVFKRWLAERKAELAFRPARPAAEESPAPEAAPARSGVNWGTVIAAALVALAIAFTLWQRVTDQKPAPPAAAKAEPTEAVVLPPAVDGTPPVPATIDTRAAARPGLTGYAAAQHAQREFRPWLVVLLLALPLPMLVLLYAPALVLSRRHGERARRAGRVNLDVSGWRKEAERIVPVLALRTAARLDRHVRPPADDPTRTRAVLDVDRSLAATLRRHALTLRWRPRRARPAYLMLVDIHDEHDLRGRLFFRWAERLRREGVAVDIWLFDRDPRHLYPAHRKRVLEGDANDNNAVRFEHVAVRAAADAVHRLIIISDGAGFFAPDSNKLAQWWPTLHWERWRERVMFTPVEAQAWGRREVAIERAVARGDPGFLVLPLEQEALDAYSVYLTKGKLPAILLANVRQFPAILNRLPEGGLAAASPPPEDVEQLIAQLRLYLGENGLRWLAACAIPPVTRWELTLLIGEALFRELGADDETSLRWLMSTNYPRLARLPWLRQANVPDWLALRLLHELPPAMQQRLRDVVRDLLSKVPTAQQLAAGEVLELDCAPPISAGGPLPGAHAEAPAAPGDAQQRDRRERKQWLYLGFLDGLSPRQLAMRAPAKWRDFLARADLPASGDGMRRLAQMVVDWVRALAARMMWRDGQAGSGAAGLPLWVAAGWFVATAAALSVIATRPPDRLPSAVSAQLFTEHDVGIGDASELPYRALAFSGDGKRFALAEASGEVRVLRLDGAHGTARAVGPLVRVPGDLVGAHLNATGSELLTLTRGGAVTTWDPEHATAKARWETAAPPIGAVVAVAFDPRGEFVAVITNRGALQTLRRGEQQWRGKVLVAAGETLEHVAVTPESRVVAASRDRVFVHAPGDGAGMEVTLGLGATQRSWLSPDGRYAVFQDRDATLAHYADLRAVAAAPLAAGVDLTRVSTVSQFKFDAPIGDVALARGSSRIGFALRSGDAFVADVAASKPTLRRLAMAERATPTLFLSPAGTALLAAVRTNVYAYDVESEDAGAEDITAPADTFGEVRLLGTPLVHGAPVTTVAFSASGDLLLTETEQHEVRLWERAALTGESRVQPDEPKPQTVVAVAANGVRAASAGADGRIVVWSPAHGAIETVLKQETRAQSVPAALALSADGRLLASGGRDGSLSLWNLRTQRVLGVASHGAELSAVHFNAEGALLLTVGGGSARLWRIGNAGPQPAAPIGARDVVAARFPPDGLSVVTASRGGAVQRWSVSDGRLQAHVRIADADPSPAGVQRVAIPAAPASPTGPKSSALDGVLLATNEPTPSPALFAGMQLAQQAPPNSRGERRVEPAPSTPAAGRVSVEAEGTATLRVGPSRTNPPATTQGTPGSKDPAPTSIPLPRNTQQNINPSISPPNRSPASTPSAPRNLGIDAPAPSPNAPAPAAAGDANVKEAVDANVKEAVDPKQGTAADKEPAPVSRPNDPGATRATTNPPAAVNPRAATPNAPNVDTPPSPRSSTPTAASRAQVQPYPGGKGAAPAWLAEVAGLPLREARDRIGKQGFTVGNIKYTPAKSGAGTVSLAIPTGPTTVDLVVLGDPERVTVPDVTRLPLETARARLRASGLAIGSVQATASRLPATTVLSMTPSAGTLVPPNTRIGLVVANSAADTVAAKKSEPTSPPPSSGVHCRGGFVARDAFAGDSVCVTPAVRTQVQRDNAAADDRIDPVVHTFGAKTCRKGYVWREADRYLRGDKFTDKICVVPEQRDQAFADAEARASRVDPGTQAGASPPPAPSAAVATPLQDLQIAPDGRLWLVVSRQRARLIDAASLSAPAGSAQAITQDNLSQARWLATSEAVATTTQDGRVRLWNAVTGTEMPGALAHGAKVVAMAPTPDGRYLATLDDSGRMRVWDVQARRPLPANAEAGGNVATSDAARVNALALDDGARVVTAHADGSARSATLPATEPGIVRTVRPYTLRWFVLLVVLVAGCLAASAVVRRRRAHRFARLAGPRPQRLAAEPSTTVAAVDVAAAA